VIHHIDIDALNDSIENMKHLLKDGLLATDIWVAKDGLSLAGYNHQSSSCGIWTQLTDSLQGTLLDSGFPSLKRYYLLDLDGDHTSMIIRHGEQILQGILLNKNKVNMGVLLSVAVPRAIEQVGQALAGSPRG
jgi:hypothetical protein